MFRREDDFICGKFTPETADTPDLALRLVRPIAYFTALGLTGTRVFGLESMSAEPTDVAE